MRSGRRRSGRSGRATPCASTSASRFDKTASATISRIRPIAIATPGPFWSWQRFGRTSTALPDGRVIHIAGEHEDCYDPDFCIYNDVVVEYAGGRREFYLYPKDVFPPTDFHSATLVGREIILIGSLGYHDLRRIGETQVLKLDTRTLRIEPVATTGAAPGWISDHIAERSARRSFSWPAARWLRGMATGRTPVSSNSISRP